ncbi:MAG TPA: SDR family NAD(P)-dependent oxidoreductase [Acidimicrobiales bacterium]|nr:SDR family NAD(P)-dependent oxidoreductase [Acidimicrobiales bacterium]
MIRFDGQVAVVTGAGRGLGRCYAEALAARGASVVVNDLGVALDGGIDGERPADEVAGAIEAAGGSAVADHHSVADPDQAQAIVQTALDAFGRIDILVNNAGISRTGRFAEQPVDEFLAVLDTHLYGALFTTRAAWPHMRAQGYGRVVMTVSALGFWGAPQNAAYGTAKAGVYGLARALAAEGEECGVRVNCVAPAAETRMSQERFAKPGSRTWRPALVAPAVLHLAHESCELNGEVISAFAGHFSRVQVVQGPGLRFDPRGEVEVEDFVAKLDDITAMNGAVCFANGHYDALGRPLGVDIRALVESSAAPVTPKEN